jgi:hypothetical protein
MTHRPIALTLALVCAHVLAAGDSLSPLEGRPVPRTLEELWADYDPRAESLDAETLAEWEQDAVVCRVVRYRVGVFKGKPATMVGFYCFLEGAVKLPALLQIHGGGQSASFETAFADAKNGYASLSLNWGGNKLHFGRAKVAYDGPNTDWGALDATHPQQRNNNHHFAGPLVPDDFTLDPVESPRNSNWFIVVLAARRGITFLEQQPEVDPERIGVYGLSMGGKLTTNVAGIDGRVKAAVPSCGGGGVILESQADLPGCVKSKQTDLELACIADNPYLARLSCPILWLSPTNDFHAVIDNMAVNWASLPDDRVRFSIAPHLNHRHTDDHAITQQLWFDQHLKGGFSMPKTPRLTVDLHTPDGIPTVSVDPDASQPIKHADIYYSTNSHTLTRFWRDGRAERQGDRWVARCPVMTLDEPFFAYANVTYELPERYRSVALPPGQSQTDSFTISSRVAMFGPEKLAQAGVQATDRTERVIDDGSRGWKDWYRLNWAHAPLWTAATRKATDAKWRGPDGATLAFDITTETDNRLVINVQTNGWGAFAKGKPAVDYTVVKELQGGSEPQTVRVGLAELTSLDTKVTTPLADWRSVTEIAISPAGEILKDGEKVRIEGSPWKGPREIRNLRWEQAASTAP